MKLKKIKEDLAAAENSSLVSVIMPNNDESEFGKDLAELWSHSKQLEALCMSDFQENTLREMSALSHERSVNYLIELRRLRQLIKSK
ncbi:hypothetical protein [Polluticaenibacter yanchengensis]|uniref:Uncharacterized protein n=1 Tax=Polluticaenibacter yanchengensis TaxID=3014562 RepID=A0ABT4UIS9_9BACT|nr:hypothetical protein [Chitinophagaceae bacterium LY-5]